jgi:acetylornithine deacetylase/succinyl-diaminopimelate desuccinylase-like protein
MRQPYQEDALRQQRSAEDEVVELCRDLIRIDTSNADDNLGPGERAAAEYVAEKLAEVGLEPVLLESRPKRTNVVARVEGEDTGRDALILHGHLDVVPARQKDWTLHPFSGEIHADCVWGRGAVDMKHMDAMILATIRQRLSEGRKPPRDLVLAFLADEEAGGLYGAHWLVEHHPELFAGCSEAVGEVGGFSLTVANDRRLYLIQTAERGKASVRLTARGTAGHGAMRNSDNAVVALAAAVARIGSHEFPIQMTMTVRRFLEEVCHAYGLVFDAGNPEAVIGALGPISKMIGATTRSTANPTMLNAGYLLNVIPQEATAQVDCRILPGYEDEFFETLDRLIGPAVTRDFIKPFRPAVETDYAGRLVTAMERALRSEDPGAWPVPYCLPAGTDAKAFSRLGIRCFGFVPLRLPPDLDFSGMFHGVDERVPIDGLRFGVRTFDRFLDHV